MIVEAATVMRLGLFWLDNSLLMARVLALKEGDRPAPLAYHRMACWSAGGMAPTEFGGRKELRGLYSELWYAKRGNEAR